MKLKHEEREAKKILVVEDNELNQIYITATLEEAGFNLEVTPNGQTALQKISEVHFDLVLTDVNIPGLSGIELTKKIREHHSSTLPIIAISGHSEKKFVDSCLAAGMNDFVTKPFTAKQLLNAIKKAVATAHDYQHVNTASQSRNKLGASGKKMYDYSTAVETAKGDEVLLQKWISQFKESLQETTEAVNTAIKANEYPERMREFHNMLNYANYYGLHDLAVHIREFYSLRQGQPDKERFEKFFKKIKKELQAISEYYNSLY